MPWIKLHKIGDVFNHLTIISNDPIHRGVSRNFWWLCRCVCGKEGYFKGDRLRSGRIKSCGCVSPPPHGPIKYTCDFNDAGVRRAYRSWQSMKDRCHGKYRDEKKIRNYVDRGITVCDEWFKYFEAFLSDMGPRPLRKTLGRKDNEKGYEPSNCRWEARPQQDLNRRDTVWVDFNGEKQKLRVLCRRLGVEYTSIYGRLKNGWGIKRALTQPVNHYRKRR
jgi:hypothetical protein